MIADTEWTASYHPLSKEVSGVKAKPAVKLSWRKFLLRMHLSYRYPGERNTRWIWAIGVDAIAFTL